MELAELSGNDQMSSKQPNEQTTGQNLKPAEQQLPGNSFQTGFFEFAKHFRGTGPGSQRETSL